MARTRSRPGPRASHSEPSLGDYYERALAAGDGVDPVELSKLIPQLVERAQALGLDDRGLGTPRWPQKAWPMASGEMVSAKEVSHGAARQVPRSAGRRWGRPAGDRRGRGPRCADGRRRGARRDRRSRDRVRPDCGRPGSRGQHEGDRSARRIRDAGDQRPRRRQGGHAGPDPRTGRGHRAESVRPSPRPSGGSARASSPSLVF